MFFICRFHCNSHHLLTAPFLFVLELYFRTAINCIYHHHRHSQYQWLINQQQQQPDLEDVISKGLQAQSQDLEQSPTTNNCTNWIGSTTSKGLQAQSQDLEQSLTTNNCTNWIGSTISKGLQAQSQDLEQSPTTNNCTNWIGSTTSKGLQAQSQDLEQSPTTNNCTNWIGSTTQLPSHLPDCDQIPSKPGRSGSCGKQNMIFHGFHNRAS